MYKRLSIFTLFVLILGLALIFTGCSTSVSVNYYNPNWLPDGRIIAVKQQVGSVQELVNPGKITFVNGWIVVMDIDGKNEKALFECNNSFFKPLVSPDGTKIASGDGIFDMTGKLLDSVPSDNGRFMNIVDWSPDSKKVVLWCGEYNESQKYIYTYDLTIKKLSYLTEGYEPAWNNEVGIVYVADKVNLSIMSDEGKKIIDNNNIAIHWPRLLADGKTIFGIAGAFKFFDLNTSKLISRVPLPQRRQPVPNLGWVPGTPTFSMEIDYFYNAKLSPDKKYIVSTDHNRAGVYVTSVETGLGKFVAYKSDYKK